MLQGQWQQNVSDGSKFWNWWNPPLYFSFQSCSDIFFLLGICNISNKGYVTAEVCQFQVQVYFLEIFLAKNSLLSVIDCLANASNRAVLLLGHQTISLFYSVHYTILGQCEPPCKGWMTRFTLIRSEKFKTADIRQESGEITITWTKCYINIF